MVLLVDTAILGEGNVKAIVVPAAGKNHEDPGSDRDHAEIEDTEPDEGPGDANAIAAVAKAPGDGIEQPEEVDPARQHRVVAGNTQALGANGAVTEGVDGESEPGHGAENEEAPLVVGGGKGADEVGDDPNPGSNNLVGDGGPRDAAEQTQCDDDDGELNYPEDIFGPEDLAGTVLDIVCLWDDSPCEIGGLGEVDDGADGESSDEEVVEDAFTATRNPDESKHGKLKDRLAYVSHVHRRSFLRISYP